MGALMVRTARQGGGSSVRFSAVALALLAVGAGCGGGGKKVVDDPNMRAALHILSAPVHNAQAGSPMQYQAALSEPGAAEWILEQAPRGATIEQGGQLTWTPTDDEAGTQAFKIVAMVDAHMVEQTFDVTAASAIEQASAHVDPADPNGGSVTVDAPLSEVHGAALQIEPGALPAGDPVVISISSMQHPPVPPEVQMIAGLDPHAVQPIELRPTGLAFKKPVRLQLPISAGLMGRPALTVRTYDYQSGQWKKVKVLSVDKEAGIVVAEVQHFSTYVVTPDVKVLDLKLGLGGAGSACASSLLVRAPLLPTFADVPAAAINGYTGTEKTVAAVLAALPAGQALQVYLRVRARSLSGTGAQAGWALASATKGADGKLTVAVTADSHAGPFLALPAGGLAADDPELLAWMNGSRVDFLFGALGDLAAGAAAAAEVSLYVVPAGDASRPPPASANALATDELEVAALAATDGVDDDCDGAPNAWDPEPAGVAPPVLVGVPASPVHVGVGASTGFKISSPQDGVTFAWSASDPSVTILSAMGGAVGTATPSVPGFFKVSVKGTKGGASSQFSWDVIADPAAVAAANTAPAVVVSASANVARVGEPVTLTALGKDAQQAALTYAWAASDATTLSAQLGETVVFVASTPGDYLVTCVASDGSATSAPAVVTLSVLSATANRPPGVPSVTPLAAALTHAAGQAVTLTLTAKADDPDGDALTYDFAPDPAAAPTFTLTKSAASATFSTTQDGAYVFYVTATDAKGAVGPWTPVKILVLPALPGAPFDADKDGYPAGFDCDDGNPAVHPGAKEICGDNKDQDCDGHDLPVEQCDGDGDRVTPAQGDCDDKNPAIGPQMPERCDGVDNNCNGKTDEGFDVGADCTVGVGACAAAGKTVCSASYGSVVCGGKPGAPSAEICDLKDNDCNGRVDDVPGQTAATSGDAANCGGCGLACAKPANGVGLCVMGGCVSRCAAGFVDTDRDPANGCECQLTNGGVEICDGKDNDCNGAVDEGVAALVYAGPAGTMGVGVCAAGLQRCVNGALVDDKSAQTPQPEICDGLDNNCDQRVDEGFDLQNDPRNCGGCGLACAAGSICQQGRCSGGTPPMGDGGAMMVDAGHPPADDGGPAMNDAGVPPGADGGAAGGNLAICKNAAGGDVCIDLFFDRANCGACARACAANQVCGNGMCLTPPTMTCGAGQLVCGDPVDPAKVYCTDPNGDPRNCGRCGNICAGACMAGVCQGGSVDAGRATAAGGAGSCPAVAPNVCMNGTASYCVDLLRDANNCGACGRVCPAGLGCANGVCTDPPPANTCGGGLTTCATGCTSLLDDARNCGACGVPCDGTCAGGTCSFTSGQSGFGSSCGKNTDCSGGFCADQPRFGWPGGFCSSLCDSTLPCAQGQVCVGSGSSGAFGFCRRGCAADADCGRAGFLCNAGACQPDCRVAPVICQKGQICDGPTGRCVAAATPTCVQPQMTCPTPDRLGSYCTNPSSDPGNCGGCGRVCPNGLMCQGGVCGGTAVCGAPLQACKDPTGISICTDVARDINNCGACGKVCGAGAVCTGGACQGGGGTYPGLAACAASGGAPMCTNLYSDPNNCGACGTKCAATQGCFGGTCGTQPMMTCPPEGRLCSDPAGMKTYCTNVLYDSGNCGACGLVCQGGLACQNGMCLPAPDGGATQTCPAGALMCPDPTGTKTYCASFMVDNYNCGACGRMCAANQACQMGMCLPAPDGGATQTCPASTLMCPDPTGTRTYCASFMVDNYNCGGCGRVCAASQVCQMGICVQGAPPVDAGAPVCPATLKTCVPATGGGYCADVTRDPGNCGMCFNSCPAGSACLNAVCMPPPAGDGGATQMCPASTLMCPDPSGTKTYCASFMVDNNNCGGCGRICGANQTCQMGMCLQGTPVDAGAPSCPATMKTCLPATGGSYCADVTMDPGNCGMCFNRCPAGSFCQNAVCMPQGGADGGTATTIQCTYPNSACDNAYCANTMSDPANCGGCHFSCLATQTCSNGACGPVP
jgi:hypothetical protein